MSLLVAGVGLALRLAQGIAIFFIKALFISLTGLAYSSLGESKNSPLVLMYLILVGTVTVWLLTI
jgi:hypothetical protein